MNEQEIRAAALNAAAIYMASPVVSAAGANLAGMTKGQSSFATPAGVVATAAIFARFIQDGALSTQ